MSPFVTTMVVPRGAPTEAFSALPARRKPHPLVRDLAFSVASEFSVLAAGVLIVSLVGRLLGPVALGEFLLLRRVSAWLVTGTLLGMANALPRYVAHAVKKPAEERRAYFLAGSACLLASTIGVGLVLYSGRQSFARWLFGDASLANLILPLCLLLAGLAAQTAVYGYFRGTMTFRRANAIQVFHFAVIPVVAVILLYPTRSVALILNVTGGATIVAAAIFAAPIIRELAHNRLPRLRPYAVELLKYGVGRVPGYFGSTALFALGPMIAAHFVSMTEVGYLLVGSNLLVVLGYTVGPLSVVLLSKFSVMLGQNRKAEVRASLAHLMGATLDLSVFATLQLVVFADPLVRLWVGSKFVEAIPVVRLLTLAVPPYLFYMALRSSIDAISVKPLNTGNVLVAIVIYLGLTAVTLKFLPVHSLLEGIAGSLVVALVALGILTARTFKELYELSIPWRRCGPSLLAAFALGVASLLFRWILGFHESPVLAVSFGLVVSGVFVGLLMKLGSPWLGFVWKMAFSGVKLADLASGSRAA
ncbi:MAG: lipopolysaccharide biosynthesis protein [Acidobacteriia bacterium]|nr:lipopolysaccharide biosynthesis protein [Terriglobia bacterium]